MIKYINKIKCFLGVHRYVKVYYFIAEINLCANCNKSRE